MYLLVALAALAAVVEEEGGVLVRLVLNAVEAVDYRTVAADFAAAAKGNTYFASRDR